MIRKQIFFTAPGKAALLDKEIPEIKDDEILTKTIFSVVSGGTERAVLLGMPNTWGDYPRSLGYCGVGIVQQVGKDVKSVKTGDRVLVYHGKNANYTGRKED